MNTPPWETYSAKALTDLLLGNQDAARMVCDIADVSHVYDDLIDKDKLVPVEKIHGLVLKLLFDLPTNPFFAQHAHTLRPILMSGLLNWHAATEMERTGTVEELHIAHALRYAIADVVLVSMAILGGIEYAMANARRARLMCQNDTWDHYLSEHTQ